jgi:hypothetical protein
VSSCTALSSFPPQTVIRNIYSRAPNIGSTLCLFYLPTRGINLSIEPARSPGLCLCLCDNIPFDLYYPGRVSYLQEPGHGLWVLKSLYHPCLRHCQHPIEVVPTAESQSRGVYMSVDPIGKFLVLLTKPSFYCNILAGRETNLLRSVYRTSSWLDTGPAHLQQAPPRRFGLSSLVQRATRN